MIPLQHDYCVSVNDQKHNACSSCFQVVKILYIFQSAHPVDPLSLYNVPKRKIFAGVLMTMASLSLVLKQM